MTRKWNLRLLGLFFLIGILLAGCGKKTDSRQSQMRMRRSGGMIRMGAIPVKVVQVKREPISVFLLSSANLEALRQVDVVARGSGIVRRIFVEEGDAVRKNQVLAKLDDTELQLQFQQAKARADNNQRLFQRAKDMFGKNLISKEQYDDAKYQYETARAQLEAAKLQLSYATIRAPISGVVTQRLIEVGNNVGVNQKVFTMVDYDTLYARIFVPEKDIPKVRVGQKAKVTVEAYPGRVFWGRVKMINPIVDPESGTIKVTVALLKRGTPLLPGMFATVRIITETHPNALVIPKRALLLESESDRVFVVEDSVARQRDIKLGFSDGDRVEVLDGLREGEWVVVVGQEGLQNGAHVRKVTETTTVAPMPQAPPVKQGERPQANKGTSARNSRGFPGVSPEIMKRIEKRFLKDPDVRREFEKRVKSDPDFKNNPAKKMKFFREMREKYPDKFRRRK